MSDLSNKDLDEFDKEMDQVEKAAEGRKSRFKTVRREETFQEPIDPPEDDLPDGDDYSEPEERALRQTRKLQLHELVEKIGEPGYEGYHIEVYRQSPNEYDGFEMKNTRISKIKIPMSWSDLLDKIEETHGGGTFLIWVKDNMSKSVRRRTEEIDAEPKPCYEDCPDYFKDQKARQSAELSEHDRKLKDLETRRAAAEIERDIQRIEGGKGDGNNIGDLGSIFSSVMSNNTAMFTQMMQSVNETAERNAQQTREMVTRLEDKKGDSDDPLIKILGAAAPIVAAFVESNRASRELTMQMMKNSQDQMVTLFTAMMSNQGKDSSLEYFKVIQDGMLQKNELSVEMALAIYEMMSGNEENKDPKIQIMEMVAGMLEKGMDSIGKIWQMNRLQAARSRPGLPGNTAATAPAAIPQPAAGQGAAQSAQPAQAPEPQRPVKEWPQVEAEFLALPDDDQKLMFTIARMVEQSEDMPEAEDAFFVQLVMHQQMSDWVYRGGMIDEGGQAVFVPGWIHGIQNSGQLRDEIATAGVDPKEMELLDTTVFTHAGKCEWINLCLAYIHDVYEGRGDTDETGTGGTAEEEFGDGEIDEIDSEGVSQPGEVVGAGQPETGDQEPTAGPGARVTPPAEPEKDEDPEDQDPPAEPDPEEGEEKKEEPENSKPLGNDAPQDAAPTDKKKPAKKKGKANGK